MTAAGQHTGFPGGAGALILHIGAGAGDALPAYLAAAPARIVLVEPDPETRARLRQAAEGARGVEILAAAVSTDPGRDRLRRFAFDELNSLRAPTGLNALFPGLEARDPVPVAVQDPAALVAGLDPARGAANALVIEAPGEALDILRALAAAGLLDRFALLKVQAGREALYEGEEPMEAVRAFLEAEGYVTAGLNEADPDRPVLTARLDRAARLQAALGAMQVERDARAAERDAREGALRRIEAEAEAAAASAAEEAAALRARIAALTEERDALRGEQAEQRRARAEAEAREGAIQGRLTAAEGSMEQALTEARAEADHLRAELEAAAGRLADRTAARDGLQAELAALKRQSGTAVAAVKKTAEEEIAAARKAQAAAEEEAARLAGDLRLATRLQAVAQADLADLQARHRALTEAKAAQDALLASVTGRLEEASDLLTRLPSPEEAARPLATPRRKPAIRAKARGGKSGAT